MEYFPDNKLTRYTTKLPQTMELDGNWEVGLSEIHYTHSWYNVKKGEMWLRLHYKDNKGVTKMKHYELHEGYYKTPKWLINQFNRLKGKESYESNFTLSISDIDHKAWLQLKKKNGNVISISPGLQQALGFRLLAYEPGFHRADFVADLSRGLTSLYVYCPLVEHRTVGDTQAPLLRLVPIEGRDAQNVSRVFDPVHYVPLVQCNFQTVEIDIRDDTGQPVPFENGRVVVTLHFRKKRETYL